MNRKLLKTLLESALEIVNTPEAMLKEKRRPYKKRRTARGSRKWTKEELALLKAGKRVPGRSYSSVATKKWELNKV